MLHLEAQDSPGLNQDWILSATVQQLSLIIWAELYPTQSYVIKGRMGLIRRYLLDNDESTDSGAIVRRRW